MKKIKKSQSGQVLLLVILISTVLLTIGLSVSRLTTEETKISKLEEDSKRAFAAAEAGLEAAINQPIGSFTLESLNLGAGIAGTVNVSLDTAPSFTTRTLFKDEQQLFYLSSYTPVDPNDPNSQQVFGAPFSGKLTIENVRPTDFCSGVNKHAVELTFINTEETGNKLVIRKVVDDCEPPVVEGAIDKVRYGDEIDLTATPANLLVIRIIAPNVNFGGAQVSIVNADNPQNNWPAQGKTITSQAKTETNVNKKIKLFHSYPQLPAEFFVTAF